VAAGQETRLGAQALQQLKRVIDARRALVLERCWYLHRVLPLSLTLGNALSQFPSPSWLRSYCGFGKKT
jgi:hypothetical protein